MLLSQRPLTGSSIDGPLVANIRNELPARLADGMLRGRNTIVLGEPGSGRTTMLQLVASALSERYSGAVVHIDAAPWASTRDLVAAIAAGLGNETRKEETRTFRHLEDFREEQERESNDVYEVVRPRPLNERDLNVVLTAARDRRSIVIIDNLAGSAAHDIFGRFRDTIWQAPIVWLAAASVDDDDVLAPPADVFWERVAVLDRLTAEEARQLIEARIAAADPDDPDRHLLRAVVDSLLLSLDRPTPRDVIAAMAASVEPGDGRLVPGDPVRARAAGLAGGSRAVVLLYELEVLGRPAHAGDKRLLDRVRISRARASQLLNGLEAAGLVRGIDVGRRKVYEPVALT